MRFDYFSIFGYVSVVLWMAMPVLWILHVRMRPRRWFCYYALALGLAAFVFAKINSVSYVNRIEADHSADIAEAQARQAEARRMAEESRAGEVAQIRFAEDDAGDYLDVAGLDEADRKYIESFDESAEPDWKKGKKERSVGAAQDGSLEAMLDTTEKQGGIEADELEEKSERAPILMKDRDKTIANRLDALNLRLIRWLILIGVVWVLVDYLMRFNVYSEAYFPLPLPGGFVQAFSSSRSWSRSKPPRRSMQQELEWMIRRGDSFVYLTDDKAAAAAIPDRLPRMPFHRKMVDVIRAGGDSGILTDDFIFEAVWFNRASFVIDSADRAEAVLNYFVTAIMARKESRARVRQRVHVVWDLNVPLPDEFRQELVRLAESVGMSLFES